VDVRGRGLRAHLIDTPGHVDFSYEVSRSLAACEGAVLVVDAAQGLEAQTLANAHLAIDNDLEIVPVLNKIDLPAADPECRPAGRRLPRRQRRRRAAHLGQDRRRHPEVLDAVCARIPPPAGNATAPARALVFDSIYDQYRGVIAFVRVVDGAIATGDEIVGLQSATAHAARGDRRDDAQHAADRPARGGRGRYIVPASRRLRGSRRRHLHARPGRATEPLPGYLEVKPMVSPASSRPMLTATRTCATRSRS